MSLFQRIDDAVFDTPTIGIQPVASVVQYYSGIIPTAVARFLYAVCIASISWYSYTQYLVAYEFRYVVGMCACLAVGIMLIFATYSIEASLKSGTRNPLRGVTLYGDIRLFVLAVGLFGVVCALIMKEFSPASLVLYSFASYFVAADQLPPSERFRWRKLATNPA